MKTILLDCDGVLCDFVGGLLASVNEELDTDLHPRDCNQWDIGKAYGLDWALLDRLIVEPGFCHDLAPTRGARNAVAEIRRKADVYAVTSPFDDSPYWMHERSAWLKKRMGFDKAHIIHANTKRLIRGDILVDDKPENVTEWAEAWPKSTAILWEAPWNRHVCLPRNATRARSWAEVIARVAA